MSSLTKKEREKIRKVLNSTLPFGPDLANDSGEEGWAVHYGRMVGAMIDEAEDPEALTSQLRATIQELQAMAQAVRQWQNAL